MKERKVMKLASRGKRLGAACIDAIVPVIVSVMYVVATVMIIVRSLSGIPGFGYGYGYGYGDPFSDYGYGYSRPATGGTVAVMIIAVILSIAYLVVQLLMYRKSTTLGKAALGLQVISSIDGEAIGFWKMVLREWIVKSASGSILMLGYIWILIDDKNRGWHDKILDTYVVDLKESAAYNAARRYEAAPDYDSVNASTSEVIETEVISTTHASGEYE